MIGCIRRPAVAGYYYPADPSALKDQIDRLAAPSPAARAACAVLVPHGSIRQSGAVAGATLAQMSIPRRCIIMGPSHAGSLMPWSLMASGAYRTPLGDVSVDEACAHALRMRCPFLEEDAWGQRGEHAIEVVLPFLQRLGPDDLTVVPIVMGSEEPAEIRQLAHTLAQVIRMQEEPMLLVASSDLSHYKPRAQVEADDQALIDAFCTLDDARFSRLVHDGSVLMCGAGAVLCVVLAAKALGAAHGTLVKRGTSADDNGGDPHSAIGYAGIVIR